MQTRTTLQNTNLTVSRCTKAALQRKAPDLSPKSAAAHMSPNTDGLCFRTQGASGLGAGLIRWCGEGFRAMPAAVSVRTDFSASELRRYAAATMGIGMAASQNHSIMPAHAHLNLLGWVSLFLFGISPSAVQLSIRAVSL